MSAVDNDADSHRSDIADVVRLNLSRDIPVLVNGLDEPVVVKPVGQRPVWHGRVGHQRLARDGRDQIDVFAFRSEGVAEQGAATIDFLAAQTGCLMEIYECDHTASQSRDAVQYDWLR